MYDRKHQPAGFSESAMVIDELNKHLLRRNRQLKWMRRQLIVAAVYMEILLACLVVAVAFLARPDWAAIDWLAPFHWMNSGQNISRALGVATLLIVAGTWTLTLKYTLKDRSLP